MNLQSRFKILHKVTGRNEDISNTEIIILQKVLIEKSEEFLVAIGKGSIKPHQLSDLPRSTLSFFLDTEEETQTIRCFRDK